MQVTAAPEQKLVIGRNVTHRFGDSPALFAGVDFILVPNRIYALTGPSGSGKSTLLSLIAGWLDPTSGAISRVNIRSIAWVFQNPHGVANRTALDHVALPLLARGMRHAAARAQALERLAKVGLASVSAAPFRELSGGEAQRLMLARGMASRPDVLLVDEPTAQLDNRTGQSVNDAIATIADDGTIVVVATHDARTREACTDLIELGRSA
ncbi:ATP-binding cassette domain-containing protein [Leifsonia poae]|uniref:ATP-binding cassette domain-containing protein n=1 Tax=Leifsonia poae TaxID=110933 RepID=UPI003D674E82